MSALGCFRNETPLHSHACNVGFGAQVRLEFWNKGQCGVLATRKSSLIAGLESIKLMIETVEVKIGRDIYE